MKEEMPTSPEPLEAGVRDATSEDLGVAGGHHRVLGAVQHQGGHAQPGKLVVGVVMAHRLVLRAEDARPHRVPRALTDLCLDDIGVSSLEGG